MPTIERDLANQLIDLRAAIALDHHYVPASDLEHALAHHLEREQWWRAQMGRMADLVEATNDGGGRPVSDGS